MMELEYRFDELIVTLRQLKTTVLALEADLKIEQTRNEIRMGANERLREALRLAEEEIDALKEGADAD